MVFNITGTWSGTLQPQFQLPDGSWVAGSVLPTLPSGASVSSITGNGQWRVLTGGFQGFRLTSTAWVSGTAVINFDSAQPQTFIEALVKGGSGATIDGVITAATAPTNGVATLVVNETTPPALTTGQSVAAQADYVGSQFVKPYRRSQTVAQATTITASTGTTTILAAQAAGVFADLSSLIITVTPGATSNTAFTATLSDGTNSYIFDLFTGSVATVTDDPVGLNLSFVAPLPATTAATAWTLTLSSATPTVHITVVAVLQKAS